MKEAPEGHHSVARGSAPGTQSNIRASPARASDLLRPYRAWVVNGHIPGALPLAIKFCPCGAAYPDNFDFAHPRI